MSVSVQQHYQFLAPEDKDRAYEPGTVEWAIKLRDRIHECAESVHLNREQFSKSSTALRDRNGYQLLTKKDGKPFATWTEFCTYRRPWGLGYDTDDIQKIISENSKPESLRKLELVTQERPNATQRELAEVVGVSQQRVQQVITCTPEKKQAESKRISARQLYLPKDPSAAAEKIRAKFGDEFAMQLKEAL